VRHETIFYIIANIDAVKMECSVYSEIICVEISLHTERN